MFDFESFFELLKAVVVDCKDDGERFVVDDRLSVIEQVLEKSPYNIVSREPLALICAKKNLGSGDNVVLLSSHVDCLHSSSFCTDESEFLRGTFDNSFTNAVLLWAMINDLLPENAVVAFTGNEESDSLGATQVVLAMGRKQCNISFAVTLDVTNVGWNEASFFTIENDACLDMLSAHKIVSSFDEYSGKFSFEHNAEPDESWLYSDYGIPSFSFCIPASGDLHDDSGVLLRKKNIHSFVQMLLKLTKVLC